MTIKTIYIKGILEGRGIVNFDGGHAKYWVQGEAARHDNLKIAKTTVRVQPPQQAPSDDEDTGKGHGQRGENDVTNPKAPGTYIHRSAKISSNAIRNRMFSKSQPFQSSQMHTKDMEHVPYQIATSTGLRRGYLFANFGLKLASSIMISDALQVAGETLKMESNATSGSRTDTSYYLTDSIGDVTYEFEAAINIGEMAFVSCDPVFDRPAFAADHFDLYRQVLSDNFDVDLSGLEVKHYSKMHSEIPLGERGILLPNEIVTLLLADTFKDLAMIEFNKATAFARMKSMKVWIAEEDDIFFDLKEEDAIPIDKDHPLEQFLEEHILDKDYYVAYRESTPIEVQGSEKAAKIYGEYLTTKTTKKKKTTKKAKPKNDEGQ